MSIEVFRLTAFARLLENGMSQSAATLITLALHPFDDAPPVPVRRYEKKARKLSRDFARRLGPFLQPGATLNEPEVVRIALETLDAYRDWAVAAGDNYYATRYDAALRPSSGD
ncbi:MAG: hypothetical protein WEE36_02455 [Acidimicrobiia bacterium]